MTRRQLRRAAAFLRAHAISIRESEHSTHHPLWRATSAPYSLTQPEMDELKAEYDEMMLLARGLYALARDPNYVDPNLP